ncbi:MAG: hypothetical protein RL410_275 [Actinomycetota bacterium]|jgi:magnesium chelatase family protein
MSIARALSCVTLAVDGYPIEVEAHVADGLVGMNVTGMADTSINEAKDRVRAAISNSGAKWPMRRITVGLSPAALPKHGSGLDVAIAMAILSADGQLSLPLDTQTMFLGELSLDGRVRRSRGSLVAALTAQSQGCIRLFVSNEDADVVALVSSIEVIAVSHLSEVIRIFGGDVEPVEVAPMTNEVIAAEAESSLNFNQVRGQSWAKFALQVAAAGGHHAALIGPPGVGKTLLASRFPGILPMLTHAEQLHVAAIGSAIGSPALLNPIPPFAAPHHTASYTALIGGGSGVPVVGMVTRAHHGVLFLDEAPEFATNVLDALRQPLESGTVHVARREFTLTLPARFQLLIAANPCPCGHAMDPHGRCSCTPMQRKRYLARISGPLLDRIDIRVVVDSAPLQLLIDDDQPVESSENIRERVILARHRMQNRFKDLPWSTNAEIPGTAIREMFPLTPQIHSYLVQHLSKQTSARGFDRVLKVGWTLADLADRDSPNEVDIASAIALRDAQGKWPA